MIPSLLRVVRFGPLPAAVVLLLPGTADSWRTTTRPRELHAAPSREPSPPAWPRQAGAGDRDAGDRDAGDGDAGGYDLHVVGNPRDVVRATRPGLVLMGGGKDIDDCFRRLIDRSAGGDFVVIRSSGTDAYNPYLYGLSTPAGLRPDSVTTLIVRSRSAAADPRVVATIAGAEAIWIAGGDQAKHVRYWRGTPLLAAVEAAAARGVPLGGTSSGLDVLGQFLYSAALDADDMPPLCSREALGDPFQPRVCLERDFLQVPQLSGLMLESHFLQHDRMGRLAAFLGRVLDNGWTGELRAIGIQSRTALLVEPDGMATVVCAPDAIRPAVYFMRLAGEAAGCRRGLPFNARQIEVDQVRPGGVFHLPSWSGPRSVSYALSATEGVLQSSHAGGAIYPE